MTPEATRSSNELTPERWERLKELFAAALDMGTAERAAYLDQIQDPSLRNDLERLLAAEKNAGTGFLNDSAIAAEVRVSPMTREGWIGRRVGPYKIVKEIGEGGMGTVYQAVRADDEYQKRVAVKLLRGGFAGSSELARFKAERQILANLEHPNVTRLLDGGTTDEGLPFLVMELVEGQPIDEYCDARQLTIAERLGLFRTVCSAVQYAHQNLIIHRDLKPGNILVTPEGVPKLLDFGIAKILDPLSFAGVGEFTTGFMRILTPEYASPEQVRGETITTASDVYSLGVVLYVLLTGRHPYALESRSPQDIAKAVCDAEPLKPSAVVRHREDVSRSDGSQLTLTPELVSSARSVSAEKLRRQLSGDLDNIVLMALRKEPQRRYASVEQFSQDIRRHPENLPVVARADTFRYRTSKFLTRHKAGVAAAAAVLLTLLLGMAVTVREARIARQQAEIARVQRVRAELRFNDVRELANSLIFDVYDSVQDLPGSTGVRKVIVDRGLRYLDGLAQESKGDLSLQRELAAAYERVGDVQGFEFNTNLGDKPGALKSYEKALTIRKAMSSSDPGNVDDAIALAESLRRFSQILLFLGETGAARENSHRAVEVAEQLQKFRHDDPLVLQELVLAYLAAANVVADVSPSSLDENSTAMVFRRKQLDSAERLANLNPADNKAQGLLGLSIMTMGDELWSRGEIRSALQEYSRARPILEDQAARAQGRARARYVVAELYQRIGNIQLSHGDPSLSVQNSLKALNILQGLSSADPRDAESRLSLIEVNTQLAHAYCMAGNMGEATVQIDKAFAIAAKTQTLDPNDVGVYDEMTKLYNVAGNLETRSGDDRKALSYYQKAISVLTKLQSEHPSTAFARQRLASTYNNIGRTQIQMQNFGLASDAFREALILVGSEGSSGQPNVQSLYTEADSYAGLGDVESRRAPMQMGARATTHWRRACDSYEASLKISSLIKEPGMISPDGFELVSPSTVASRLSKCRLVLASAAGSNTKVHR